MKIKRYRIFKFVQFVEYPQTEKCVKSNNWLRKRTSKPQPYQIEYVRFALCVVFFYINWNFVMLTNVFTIGFAFNAIHLKQTPNKKIKKKNSIQKWGDQLSLALFIPSFYNRDFNVHISFHQIYFAAVKRWKTTGKMPIELVGFITLLRPRTTARIQTVHEMGKWQQMKQEKKIFTVRYLYCLAQIVILISN